MDAGSKAMKSIRQKLLKKNETHKCLFSCPFLSALLVLAAGEDEKSELRLSLDDAIAMARVRSVDAAEALDELRSAYWDGAPSAPTSFPN